MVFLIYGWSGVVFYLCANDMIGLLFGDRYVLSQGVCTFLVANSFMFGMIVVVGIFMDAVGVFAKGRLVVVITSILNVVLSIIFGIKWGVIGVLAATVVARLITNWWYQPRALFKFGFEASSRRYFTNYFIFTCLVILTAFLVTVMYSYFSVSTPWIAILIKTLCASIVYAVGVCAVYRRSDEFEYSRTKMRHAYGLLLKRISQ
jgi:O-antigen/teichoic acid export membrane protein